MFILTQHTYTGWTPRSTVVGVFDSHQAAQATKHQEMERERDEFKDQVRWTIEEYPVRSLLFHEDEGINMTLSHSEWYTLVTALGRQREETIDSLNRYYEEWGEFPNSTHKYLEKWEKLMDRVYFALHEHRQV